MTTRYTLISEIGRGAMGIVYKARDEETGTIVALKLLRDVYAEDPEYVKRFEREAQLAARIDSIHVVKVLDYGLRDNVPYLALEYVDGPSLHDALTAHGAYDWPDARAILAQLAQGLADANAAGVIHRDIKPSNILVAPDGTAKLTDFGIARGLDMTRFTATGTIVGTPAYLAPEGPRDARSDLYSLGVIGYELLTGSVPFRGTTYQEIVVAHIREAPDLTKLPDDARPVIAWLLAKDPADRPARASALLPVLWGGAEVPGTGSGRAVLSRPIGATVSGRGERILDDASVGATVVLPAQPRQVGAAAPQLTGAEHPGPIGQTAPTVLIPPVRRSSLSGWGRSAGVGGLSSARGAPGSRTAGTTRESPTVAGVSPQATQGHGRAVNPFVLGVLALLLIGSLLVGATNLWSGKSATATGSPVLSQANLGATPLPTATGVPAATYASGTFHSIWMVSPRVGHAAALLADGRVLIVGGCGDAACTPLNSAETYDPVTNSFKATGSLATARVFPTAVTLLDGRVLVAGGCEDAGCTSFLGSAEVYDPSTGKFGTAGSFGPRTGGVNLTLLPSARVLVTGGGSSGVWDATTGAFVVLAGLNVSGSSSSVMLSNDFVLILSRNEGARLFDAVTRDVSPAGSVAGSPLDPLLIPLEGGRALVAGGFATGSRVATTAIFDFASMSFQVQGSMLWPRELGTGTRLTSGEVLIAGGCADASCSPLSSAELYDPSTETFRATGSMRVARTMHTATLLRDGSVLMVGGDDPSGRPIASAEIYTP